jgi:hypothetical protein
LYVLAQPEQNQVVVEDAASDEVRCVRTEDLMGWRIVEPDRAA